MNNKKLLINTLTLLSLTLIFSYPLFGQISVEGTPFGLIEDIRAKISDPVWLEMEKVNVNALIEEDKTLDTLTAIPYRFGENLHVDLNPKNSGVWDILDDGSRIWRLGITSRGAVSINLAFNRYHLPEGARLFVYTPDGEHVIGAFSELNNQEDGYFATTLITGDQIIIEYYVPAKVDFPGELNLWRVTHGYRGPGVMLSGRAFGDSGECNQNVACPEGHCWDFHSRSVGMMVVNGNGFCTGFLVNTTSNMGIPYFLSADHCYRDPSTVVFWFNWQSPTCDNPTQVPPHDAISGAVTRARWTGSDFWLLQLNQSPPWEYNVYYSGWNRTMQNSISGTVVGIHHPKGDIKKISWADGGVTRSTSSGAPNSGTTHWRVGSWSGKTTTEVGSSGSPLYDPQGYVIGQLSGGLAECGNTLPDWYGRIGASWTGGGTNATRLRNWLDPDNTFVMTWHGYDPNIQMNISGPSLLCSSDKIYNLGSLPVGLEATWSFSPAYLVNSSTGVGTSAILRMASSSSSGKGTITFSIKRPGCENIITKVAKEIWVGAPSYEFISGPMYTPNNQWAFYTAEPNNLLMNAYYSHTWILNPLNGNSIYPAGRTIDIAFYNPGDYQLMVRGQNECGTGPNRVTGIHVYDTRSLTITPNPATSEATFTIESSSGEKNLNETNEWDLEVYNSQQMLVKKMTRIRSNEYTLQTTGWRAGTYIVRVIYGNEILNGKLLIVGH
ncbi:MAG: trypsin-like peptidase domain-containing protein [Bacteroidales bacterium]